MSGRGRGDSRELSGLKGAGESDGEEILVISNQHSPAGCHSVLLRVVPPPLFSSFFLFWLFLYLCSIPSSLSGCSSTFVQLLFSFRLFLYLCSTSCSPSGRSSTCVQFPVSHPVVPLCSISCSPAGCVFLTVVPFCSISCFPSSCSSTFVQFSVPVPFVSLPVFSLLFPCRLSPYLCLCS